MTISDQNASASHDDDVSIGPDEIQFELAEFTNPVPSGPTCDACHRPILESYYEINGKVVCASCRQAVEAGFRGGSRLGRVIKAWLFGSVAAMAGSALYYAFVRLTNINFGLVAVLLGFMVGGAVRKGSGNRGGRFYQLLAVFLTYSAIVGMQAPAVMEVLTQAFQEEPQADAVPTQVEKPAEKPGGQLKAPAPPNADFPANPFADAREEVAGRKLAVAKDAGAPKVELAPEPATSAFRLAIFVVLVVLFSWAIPVLEVVHAPISGLIYGFALWEAWKMNRAVRLTFNGPFRVSAQGSSEWKPEVDENGE